MTILDDLAASAAAQRAGTSDLPPLDLPLCYISKIPVDWCVGCRKGLHKFTQQPVRGSEPEVTVCDVVMDAVDAARDPDYCPRCTPLYGTCRCEIAASE